MKEWLRTRLLEAGACAVGFADAKEVPAYVADTFRDWLADGCHAEMLYLERNEPLRRDPRLLLPEALSIASTAWPYNPRPGRDPSLPYIAKYAYGADYHKAIRKRLRPVIAELRQRGVECRVCVDSAPIAERHFAFSSGIAMRGLNGCAIVPGRGSRVFLAELLLNVGVEPDAPDARLCGGCRRCLDACPTGALRADGTIDSRRCINYLTIEHPSAFSPGQRTIVDDARTIFGCDRCQDCCPHNRDLPPGLPEFELRPEIAAFDPYDISPEDFDRLILNSPLRRPGLSRLRRNHPLP